MGHFLCCSGRTRCGRGGIGRRARFRFWCPRRKSSSLFVRTFPIPRSCGSAVVAQLVERHLAKVEVASPSLVYRSICRCNSMVEFQPSKLATWVRFPSPALKPPEGGFFLAPESGRAPVFMTGNRAAFLVRSLRGALFHVMIRSVMRRGISGYQQAESVLIGEPGRLSLRGRGTHIQGG